MLKQFCTTKLPTVSELLTHQKHSSTGEPVAWCVSNYETTQVIELFLMKIKLRCPGTRINVLMSDDGTCLLYAWHITTSTQTQKDTTQWLPCTNLPSWKGKVLCALAVTQVQSIKVQTLFYLWRLTTQGHLYST